MTYFCRDCHETFEEPDTEREWVGDKEHGGYVEYSECPNCGSEDIDDALMCPNCGEFCGELFGAFGKERMCEECIKEFATEENLIRYGYEDKQKIEINGYLAEMFSPDEIDRLLKTELDDRQKYGRCADKDKSRRDTYIEDCKDNLAMFFAEMQAAEGK